MTNQPFSSFKRPQRCEIYYIWWEVVSDINYSLAKKFCLTIMLVLCSLHSLYGWPRPRVDLAVYNWKNYCYIYLQTVQ